MAQRGRPRKSSVSVAMADDVDDLLSADEILAGGRPGQPDADDPDENDPNDDDLNEDDPEEDDEGNPIPADPLEPASEPPSHPAAERSPSPPTAVTTPNTGVPLATAGTPNTGSRASRLVDGEVLHPQTVRYEARIQILEAWQYLNSLTNAPDWVDRNWIGYAEADEANKLPAGPAIRVPTAAGIVLARRGDFICKQEVRITAEIAGEIRIEVWQREVFERLFLPIHASPKQELSPLSSAA